MLFYKKYVLRRFQPTVYIGGHSTSSYTNKALQADVQTLQNASTTAESGADGKQRIKVFSKEKIQLADSEKGVRADWLYFQEKWFEAVSCRLSENTLLKHYTSEFEEIQKTEFTDYLKAPVIEEENKDPGESDGTEEGDS